MSISRFASRVGVLSLALLTVACSPNRMIGTQLNHFATDHVIPSAMTLDDISLVCHANESTVPLFMGYEHYKVNSDLVLAFSYSGSAICTEQEAVEKELWSTLAAKQKWYDVAQDARISQQLLNRDAGLRQLKAYQYAANYFKNNYRYDIGEGECPKFKKQIEEYLLLVSATSALQALQNDISSGRLVGVDMSIPPKIGRAMACLNNEKWWGEPQAIAAGLKTILPKDANEERAAWKGLQDATDVGLQTGVRLSHAIYATMASAKGREDYLRDALKRFEAVPVASLDPKYKLLNQISALQIRHVANRYWMANEGHRAPTENFSVFWDEKAQPSKEMNKLLDDM